MAVRNRSPRILAAVLTILLWVSPSAALRMMTTLRFTALLSVDGPAVSPKLKLQRKTPPQPVEATRPLVIRKADETRTGLPFDRGHRDGAGRTSGPVVGFRSGPALNSPVYLKIFLASTPQNPLYPPADDDPLAS